MRLSNKKALLVLVIAFVFSVVLGMIAYHFLQWQEPKQYQTLSEINAYAKTLPEFPISDDNEWLDPHYEKFYISRSMNMFGLLLRYIGLEKEKPWNAKYLATLVKELTKKNHELGLVDGKNNFVHIKSTEKTKVYVFGDVHAAFHSVIRDLQFLKEEGVIDENLKIMEDYSYLVFNGDFIDRSPYNIDSLILLCTLLKNNPLNAFYVAGNHERNLHWLDYSLKRELVVRARHLSKQHTPFQDQLDAYFRTLPEAIYLSDKKATGEVIRIAFFDEKRLAFNQTELSPRFLSQTEPVKIHSFLKRELSERAIDVIAAIKTEEWRKSNRIRHGLGLLDQDEGATVWAILSSPTSVHKAFLNFHDDAFAVIELGQEINKTTITQIYNNGLTQEGFKKNPPKNIVTSRAPDGITESKIKIASTLSLVRGVPSMGRQVQRGLNSRINQFNQENNLHIIRLYVDNDDYVPKLARANVLNYLDSHIKFLLLPTGTPTIMSYIDMVKPYDFMALFPISGAAGLRNPKLKNLIHFRASYDDEVRAIIQELIAGYRALKFAFFYQDDSYGQGPFKTAIEELSKAGITQYLAMPYTRGTVDFRVQIKQMEKSQPDAVGFFATATATQEFIRQLGVESIANTQLFAISFSAEITLRQFAKRYGLSFMFGSSVPNPKISETEIAKMYRQQMDDIKHNYDVFSFEAYVGTSIFLHAVETLGKKDISPKNVMNVLESIKDLDFKGVNLGFDPKTRSLARSVFVETGDDMEWLEYKIHP